MNIPKNRLRNMRAGILVSLSACFMLFIFAPLEIYMTNPGEFWYTPSMLFGYCLLMFLTAFGVSAVLFCLACLLGRAVYHGLLALYFAAFIGCYIQGNYLVEGLPVLDRDEVDWSLYGTDQVKSVAVWIIVAVLTAI